MYFGIMEVILTWTLLVISGFMCFGNAQLQASFVFGDSLVDAGNNNYLVSLSKANYAPNGIDFGSPTGRYTNGRTIVDIIGQEMGLPDYTPPYLAPTTKGSVVLKGVNYASGGGGVLKDTGQIFGGRLSLDAQLDFFANTREDIINSIGDGAAQELFQKALFSVTMGSNDFINNYLVPVISAPEQKLVPPQVFVASMIDKITSQLTRLYVLGARKIVVVNVGPIGCIPYQRDLNPQDGDNCATFPNQLAQSYNSRLRNVVEELNSNLQGSKFVYADVYKIVDDIILNYSSYGFESGNSACCHLVGRFGGLLPCGPSPMKVCDDRSKFLFWDVAHPSDAANVFIAKALLDGDSTYISPINVRQLVIAN